MSHQTGIRATEELKLVFSQCKSERDIRCLKLSIDKEQLKLDQTLPMSSSSDWKNDWSAYIKKDFVPKQNPCYLLFRLDPVESSDTIVVAKPPSTIIHRTLGPEKAKNNNNNNIDSGKPDGLASSDKWLFVSWSPESSSIREKMIYASTKSTLKIEFGGESIFADYFASSNDDLLVDIINKWIERKRGIRDGRIDLNELSLSEQELQQVKLDEAAIVANLAAMCPKDGPNVIKSLPRIEMPISDDAINAMFDFKQGKSSYVQLSIDPKNETIQLEKSEPSSTFSLGDKTLARLTPKDHARYHLLSFAHQRDKKSVKSTLFIYSIPSSGCPVKERMLYSSCKNWLVHVIEKDDKIGITVGRKLETDDPSELTEKFLMDELYPVEAPPPSQTFVKPKGPTKQHNPARRKVM